MMQGVEKTAGWRRQPQQLPRWFVGSAGVALIAIGAGILGVMVLGGTAGAQTVPAPPPRPLASLKTVPVPVPPNLGEFVQNPTPGSPSMLAAIRLGKALFWDMQVGSDGVQACASCHFVAGADNRSKNQVSPGLNAGDRTFQVGGSPNYQLTEADFPFHKVDPTKGAVLRDSNDVTSSQGVFRRDFVSVTKGSAVDTCNRVPDPNGFSVGGLNVRRVEPRNAPTVINAVFNFRNFWDGRANNSFNGVNPFGQRDPNAVIYQNDGVAINHPVHVDIQLGSLASQAVGPPGSKFEMSCDSRTFPAIGRKLLKLRPLTRQWVDPNDSVLGPIANSRLVPPAPGIQPDYDLLIQQAFRPEYWNSTPFQTITIGGVAYRQIEANFSLFFGLAVQLYESTLVANDSLVDRYFDGTGGLTADQLAGLNVFTGQGRCMACHGGPELTNASVSNVTNERLERMHMGNDGIAVYDNGFYNTGVRPTLEDVGVGGTDPFGNPLSETGFCQAFIQQHPGQACPIKNENATGQLQNTSISALIGPRPNENIVAAPLAPPCPQRPTTSVFDPTTGTFTCDRINVMGAHKTPGLRNVELTGPYMHNGGMATLRQVVDFYNRGGDFAQANQDNLDPNIVPLGLTETQKNQLVAFMLALTDNRVKLDQAPFDHPQLFVPNGHPTPLTNDSNNPGQATDSLLMIPAVGAAGRDIDDPVEGFLDVDQFAP